ncbi:hypothetical protein GCM10028803_19110 [Larkinella knui]|uniref:Uncharacterized protein n=1 Tax=Larkinella knui TaxID=2025310 RepID=A0A3P1CUS9_9BACT|nr:hypothetical protein [Larkinella knui]RRB17008.1 hypothetical protein EHT87_01620 [Larkinella knui]
MDSTFRLQQQAFFKQFNEFSDRAKKHWPIPDALKKVEKEPEIGYIFEIIVDQAGLHANVELVDDFFELYQNEEHFFSGTLDENSPQGASSFEEKQRKIRSQIPTTENLQKCKDRLRKCNSLKLDATQERQKLKNELDIPQICTFLILAYKPVNDEYKQVARKIQAGFVGHFFPKSGTILLETILIASVLQSDGEQKVAGLLKEYGINNRIVDNNKEKNRQTVIDWLLTFQHPQKANQRSALITLIEKIGADLVNGVFHEIQNPVLAPDKDAQQKAATSLEAFHAINARYLKFAYHHPVPDTDTDKNAHLRKSRQYFLLTFPQVLQKSNNLVIESGTVMSFITDYGKYLYSDYPEPNYKQDLAASAKFKPKSKSSIEGFWKGSDPISLNNASLFDHRLDDNFTVLYLHNVPRLEQPRFIYRRASVGFEILVDEDYFEPIGIHPYHDMTPPQPELTRLGRIWSIIRKEWGHKNRPKPDTLYCPVAHSGETDLFSYKYQAEPPYFTRYYAVPEQTVTVKFPSHFEFTSEGRMECFYQLPQTDENSPHQKELKKSLRKDDVLPRFSHSVKMTACVSYTYFLKSAVRVWHLVLKPNTEDISELDIVKLMRFFSGSQEHEDEDERRKLMRQIEFSLPNRAAAHSDADAGQQPEWYSFLSRWFSLPVFTPDPSYHESFEQKLQKWVWRVKTWGRVTFWFLAGLAVLWLWQRQLPIWLAEGWKWQLPTWTAVFQNREPLEILEKTLYWAVGLFILGKTWSWLFQGLYGAFRDGFGFIKSRIIGLFIKNEVADEMTWLDKPDNLIQLLQDLTGVKYEFNQNNKFGRLIEKADQAVSLRNIRSGVVEIDTGDTSPEENKTDSPPDPENDSTEETDLSDVDSFLGFRKELDPHLDPAKRNEIRNKVKELYKDLHDDAIHMSDELEPFTAEEYADYVFKAYCGICLGIFDYDRMGLQEIDDTLVPLPNSKTESSFMVIHRGVMAMLGYGDDVMDTFWDTLGINAYLLIPSAVLAHNDMVARDAENRLNTLLNDLRTDKSRLTIPELIEQRNVIDDLLNDDILGDVFQYKTEQELYKEGMERRGIAERVKDARSKLEQMDKLISTKQEERTSEYQRRIQYIVTIVGAFSFYQIVHDFFVNEVAREDPGSKEKFVNLEDIPSWFLLPIKWLDGISQRLFKFEILPYQSCYDPLDLAHLAIKLVFIGLILFLLFNILFDPNKSRKHFWQRRNHHRTLPKTHAPNPKNRSSSPKRKRTANQ